MLRFSAAFAARLRDAAPSCSSSLSASPDVSDVARPPIDAETEQGESHQTEEGEAEPPNAATGQVSIGTDGHHHIWTVHRLPSQPCQATQQSNVVALLVLDHKTSRVFAHLTTRRGRRRAPAAALGPEVAARTAGRARPRGLSV